MTYENGWNLMVLSRYTVYKYNIIYYSYYTTVS